ncbi:MAG: PD-(D/E)XK nuclease family protein [Gammaproteobacteria bacterium]
MDQAQLFSALCAGATIVTANQRLANYLQQWFADKHQHHHGFTTYITPTISALQPWAQQLWTDYSAAHSFIQTSPLPTLLTSAQQRYCWNHIIEQYTAEDLITNQATLNLAIQAWDLLQHWQIPLQSINATTPDAVIFQRWAEQYHHFCQQRRLLDPSQLLNCIGQLVAENHIALPHHLIVSGFDSLSPDLSNLFAIAKQQGVQITEFAFRESEAGQEIHQTVSVNSYTELLNMAHWAQQQFIAGKQRVGCVVPDLLNSRHTVLRIFQQLGLSDAINISAGYTLSEHPLIHTAWLIIKLNQQKLNWDEWSYLLRSPYFMDAEQSLVSFAELDQHLRANNYIQLSISQMIMQCHALPRLQSQLVALQSILPNGQQSHSPYEWRSKFIEQLTLLGWPGQRSLNSEEYQLVERWYLLLDEYTQLAHLTSSWNCNQALHYLRQYLQQTLFQAQSAPAPIQILGLLEAASLPFDALWVSGLSADAWPAIAQANPFLPYELQRKHHMPHASAQRELAFSQKIMQRFLQQAPTIIFSYPQQRGEQQLLASPLIAHYPSKIISNTNSQSQHSVNNALEKLLDAQAPPVAPTEKLRGGNAILKNQAICPFKAFAEIRLTATTMTTPTIGFDPPARGAHTHHALELLWQRLGSHQQLCALNEEQLTALIQECIDAVEFENNTQQDYLIALEKNRLQHLLQHWVQIEKQRPSFTVVACEQTFKCTIGELSLKLRIDRIDQLSNGDYLVIDYKTGKPSIRDWFDSRLSEPQLPLYCIMQNTMITGIAYAQVRIDDARYKGVCDHQENLEVKGIENLANISEHTSWQQQRQIWQQQLHTLANEFMSGIANVAPLKGDQTCMHCGIQSLCRIGAEVV